MVLRKSPVVLRKLRVLLPKSVALTKIPVIRELSGGSSTTRARYPLITGILGG